jgi:hypothetical protein
MPLRNELSYRQLLMSDRIDSASDHKVPPRHRTSGLLCMLLLASAILTRSGQCSSHPDFIRITSQTF